MNGPQFVGHPVGDVLRVAVIPLIVLIALAGWNISREVRLRRAPIAHLTTNDAQLMA